MVTALSVLCFVEYGGINHFYFAGTIVPLEVPAVIVRIPKTPFYIGEEGEIFGFGRTVGKL